MPQTTLSVDLNSYVGYIIMLGYEIYIRFCDEPAFPVVIVMRVEMCMVKLKVTLSKPLNIDHLYRAVNGVSGPPTANRD